MARLPHRPGAPLTLRTPLFLLLAGCEGASIYYPKPVPDPPGWGTACLDPVVGTVSVENDADGDADVYEFEPEEGCPATLRGTVAAGESADLGDATGSVWRAYRADSGEWLATFVLVDGANDLVVP